ncbi:MAG: undecaprenyl-diphosphate phosphatase [Pseudomonadota bacterium]
MVISQTFFTAFIQGLTEFLPVSSSGHLRLLAFFHEDFTPSVSVDIAVHVGTLFALMLYFWRDFARLTLLKRADRDEGLRLWGLLVIGTLPVILMGFVLHRTGFLHTLSARDGAWIVAWGNLIFALPLWLADRFGGERRTLTAQTAKGTSRRFGWGQALLVGIAQVCALVPGASRSGVVMTAARALGLPRDQAARFAMLLAAPAIAGAGLLEGLRVLEAGDVDLTMAAVAAVLSFLVALITIRVFMVWVARIGFAPFALYRLALGVVLLWWLAL